MDLSPDDRDFVKLVLGDMLDRLCDNCDGVEEFRKFPQIVAQILHRVRLGEDPGAYWQRAAASFSDAPLFFDQARVANPEEYSARVNNIHYERVGQGDNHIFERVMTSNMLLGYLRRWKELRAGINSLTGVNNAVIRELNFLVSHKEPTDTWKLVIVSKQRTKYLYRLERFKGKAFFDEDKPR